MNVDGSSLAHAPDPRTWSYCGLALWRAFTRLMCIKIELSTRLASMYLQRLRAHQVLGDPKKDDVLRKATHLVCQWR